MAASSSTTFGTIPDLPIVDDSTLADQLTIIDTAFDQFSDFLLSENASFVSSCTYLQTCKNGEDPVAVDISSVPWPVFSKCLSLHSGVPHESLKPLLDVTGEIVHLKSLQRCVQRFGDFLSPTGDLLEAAEKRWINFDTSTAKGMVVSRDLEGAFLFAVSPRMSPFPFHLMWLQHGKPTFAKVKRISYSPFAKNLFGIRLPEYGREMLEFKSLSHMVSQLRELGLLTECAQSCDGPADIFWWPPPDPNIPQFTIPEGQYEFTIPFEKI